MRKRPFSPSADTPRETVRGRARDHVIGRERSPAAALSRHHALTGHDGRDDAPHGPRADARNLIFDSPGRRRCCYCCFAHRTQRRRGRAPSPSFPTSHSSASHSLTAAVHGPVLSTLTPRTLHLPSSSLRRGGTKRTDESAKSSVGKNRPPGTSVFARRAYHPLRLFML